MAPRVGRRGGTTTITTGARRSTVVVRGRAKRSLRAPPRPNDTPCELEVHSAHELAVLPVSAWNGAALKRDRGGDSDDALGAPRSERRNCHSQSLYRGTRRLASWP